MDIARCALFTWSFRWFCRSSKRDDSSRNSRCKVGESSLESMIREAMAKAFSTGESEAKDKLITATNGDSALLQEAKDWLLLQLVV